MRIILKQEVDNLGLAGDVVDVADGYGRNYLIPRGLAIKATRGALKEAETLTRARKAHEAKTLGAAQEHKRTLEARILRIPVRVDERGHLYGSVGAVDVQRALKDRGHDIERRRIDLPRAIKEIGEYTVAVHVHPQVVAEVPIEVVDVEGKVTPESLLAARRGARESIEERALARAEELEGVEAADTEEAVGEAAATAPAGPAGPEQATTGSAASTASSPEEALAAAASAPTDIEETRVEDLLDEQDEGAGGS